MTKIQEEFHQYRCLVGHFFVRLFKNDMVFLEDQMKQKILGLIAMLAVFCGHVSNMILSRYLIHPDAGTSWLEKCYIITLLMTLMGFISVFEWEVIFPDRRDFANLMPLPIRPRTLFAAKFTSLFIFVGMFSLGMSSLSALVFTYHLPRWHSDSLLYGLQFLSVQFLTSLTACLFIFFSTVFIIGVLMLLLGYRLFSRVSTLIRGTFLVLFIILIVLVATETMGTSALSISRFPELKEANSSFLYLFPPMWFVGLNESLLGRQDLLFSAVWRFALLALLIPMIGFFVLSDLTYRRYLGRMLEGDGDRHARPRWAFIFRDAFNRIFLRNQVQRAVFDFTRQCLRRSMFHKMRLAVFVAFAVASILIVMASEAVSLDKVTEMKKTLLSIPLVLSFFLLIGLRGVLALPLRHSANWIFRLTEQESRQHYFMGMKKAIVFTFLLPLHAILVPFYGIIWDPLRVVLHLSFTFVVSLLLMEGLFFRFNKISFTCASVPGREKMHVLWLVYLLSFIAFVSASAAVEAVLLRRPIGLVAFIGTAFLALAGIRYYQARVFYPRTGIVYEEEPEPVMIELR